MYWLLNSNQIIIRHVTLLIPLNSETLSSYLTPILAQYGIKFLDFVSDFIMQFSKYSSKSFPGLFDKYHLGGSRVLSNEDLIIKVILTFNQIGKYNITFEHPPVNFLLNYFINSNFYKFNKTSIICTIYKLAYVLVSNFGFINNNYRVKKFFINIYNYIYKKKHCKLLYSKSFYNVYKNISFILKKKFNCFKIVLFLYQTSLKLKTFLRYELNNLGVQIYHYGKDLYSIPVKNEDNLILIFRWIFNKYKYSKFWVTTTKYNSNLCLWSFIKTWIFDYDNIKLYNFNIFIFFKVLFILSYGYYKFFIYKTKKT